MKIGIPSVWDAMIGAHCDSHTSWTHGSPHIFGNVVDWLVSYVAHVFCEPIF
jgi:hypothetical protein